VYRKFIADALIRGIQKQNLVSPLGQIDCVIVLR
jgi:hypothetical protein